MHLPCRDISLDTRQDAEWVHGTEHNGDAEHMIRHHITRTVYRYKAVAQSASQNCTGYGKLEEFGAPVWQWTN
jgi:hypothetical protein